VDVLQRDSVDVLQRDSVDVLQRDVPATAPPFCTSSVDVLQRDVLQRECGCVAEGHCTYVQKGGAVCCVAEGYAQTGGARHVYNTYAYVT